MQSGSGGIMDYVKGRAAAALGARLRRLSARIDHEASQAYAVEGVEFHQRWFGVLNQLVLNGPMSVGEVAQALGITQVSVSQTRLSLEAAGLVEQVADARDARRRLLALSDRGRALVKRLTPLWAALEAASAELDAEVGGLVERLDRLEAALDRRSLTERVQAVRAKTGAVR